MEGANIWENIRQIRGRRSLISPPGGGKGGNGHSVLLAGSLFVAEKSPPILGGRDTLGVPFGPRVLQPRPGKLVIKTPDGESARGYFNRPHNLRSLAMSFIDE